MVKYIDGLLEITDSGDKVLISKGKQSYHCTIKELPLRLPLPYGDGTYIIRILRRIEGIQYRTIKIYNIKAKNTSDYLLKFNLYVPRTDAVDYAIELCKDKDALQSYNTIVNWAKRTIVYDHIKALQLGKTRDVLPAPQECWEKKRGICQDISSMVVGMLRGVGVPAQLVIGSANGKCHAWVETNIDGKSYQFDHDKPNLKTVHYVAERYY